MAIAAKPGVAEYHRQLGDASRAAGALDRSQAAYRRAVEINPADGESHNQLGDLLLSRGRHQMVSARSSGLFSHCPAYAYL